MVAIVNMMNCPYSQGICIEWGFGTLRFGLCQSTFFIFNTCVVHLCEVVEARISGDWYRDLSPTSFILWMEATESPCLVFLVISALQRQKRSLLGIVRSSNRVEELLGGLYRGAFKHQ